MPDDKRKNEKYISVLIDFKNVTPSVNVMSDLFDELYEKAFLKNIFDNELSDYAMNTSTWD